MTASCTRGADIDVYSVAEGWSSDVSEEHVSCKFRFEASGFSERSVCRQAVPHTTEKGRATAPWGPTERLIENYGNSTHFDNGDGGNVVLQNVGNIATVYARPNTPRYAKQLVLSEGSPCGIFGGLSGTRQIFLRVHRLSPLCIIPILFYIHILITYHRPSLILATDVRK
jgi:hypothetical protein